MKSSCNRCWDKESCICTPEELAEYEAARELPTHTNTPVIYSLTEPAVCEGDIIVLDNGLQLVVKEVIHGVPLCSALTNNLDHAEIGLWRDGAEAFIKTDQKYSKVLPSKTHS